MKKLIMAAAVACSALLVEASSVNWIVEGIQVNGSWTTGEGDLADGYLVYLIDDSAYSQTQMASDIAAAATGDTAWKTALESSMWHDVAGANGNVTKTGLELDSDRNFSGYMVILDAGTVDAAENAFVTMVYTANDTSTHKINFNKFDEDSTWIDATNPAGWKSVAAVPEPTSGLLLLLGVAGLALRRRRA